MDIKQRLSMFTDAKVVFNAPMKNYTGYKTGGRADIYIEISSVKDLKTVIELLDEENTEYKILGNGTNLLISDDGYRGAIISLKKLDKIFIDGDKIVASSGVQLKKLVLYSVYNGYSGLEELLGIPATVGGATTLNVSAFGKSISRYIDSVTVLSKGKLKKIYGFDCNFSYRNSIFKNSKDIILSVEFLLKKGKIANSIKLIEDCTDCRRNTQPIGKSCGCVFTNPKDDYAGRLIEKVGLKGQKIGGAYVSAKHANFILTEKDATSSDVYNLIKLVKERVKDKFGILLKEEIEYIGKFDDANG